MKVHEMFMDQVSSVRFRTMHKPSCNTLEDCFKRISVHRREAVKRTARASGIAENHGKKEVLIDDLIQEIDKKEEMSHVGEDDQTEKEKLLTAAGERI